MDPYDVAIDQILEGADGDVRLALRMLLIQNLQLEAELLAVDQRAVTSPPSPGALVIDTDKLN